MFPCYDGVTQGDESVAEDLKLDDLLSGILPFDAWVKTLPPKDGVRVQETAAILRSLGCKTAEALARADFHSPYALAQRWMVLGRSIENVRAFWLREPGGQNLVDMAHRGERLIIGFKEVGREIRTALAAGLGLEQVSEFAAFVASVTIDNLVYHIDAERFPNFTVGWLLLEIVDGMPTGRPASGGRFNDHFGRRPIGSSAPFLSREDILQKFTSAKQSIQEARRREDLHPLLPFNEWVESLDDADGERVCDVAANLKALGCGSAEALARADFYSTYALAARWMAVDRTMEKTEAIWRPTMEGRSIADMSHAGKGSTSIVDEGRHHLEVALRAGLTREQAYGFAMAVFRFTARDFMIAIDSESSCTQLTDYLLMEVVGGRLTGRQASGGGFDLMMPCMPLIVPGMIS